MTKQSNSLCVRASGLIALGIAVVLHTEAVAFDGKTQDRRLAEGTKSALRGVAHDNAVYLDALIPDSSATESNAISISEVHANVIENSLYWIKKII
ncbi:hypothetical protein ACFLQR_02555, partial [Verrucomicrobiota bacterium]